MTDLKGLGVEDLGLVEVLNKELREKVLPNVFDENTEAGAKRSLRLTLTFKPSKKRDAAALTVAISSTLAPKTGEAVTVFLSNRGGVPLLLGRDPKQLDLPLEGVTPIRSEATP